MLRLAQHGQYKFTNSVLLRAFVAYSWLIRAHSWMAFLPKGQLNASGLAVTLFLEVDPKYFHLRIWNGGDVLEARIWR